MLDLRLHLRHKYATEQEQQSKVSSVHRSSFLEMWTKLLGNPKTDVTTHGHEQWPRGVSHTPIHSEPQVHSGAQSDIRRRAEKQIIAAAPALRDPVNPVVLRVQPRQVRPDEPFA